jgi:hypothetical protein
MFIEISFSKNVFTFMFKNWLLNCDLESKISERSTLKDEFLFANIGFDSTLDDQHKKVNWFSFLQSHLKVFIFRIPF